MNNDNQEPQSQIPAGDDPNTPVPTEGVIPEAAEQAAPYAEAPTEPAGETPAGDTAEDGKPLADNDMLPAGEEPQVYTYTDAAATGSVEPPKKKFPLIPVIVACVAVLAVCVFAFGRFGGIGNPKEYLQTALMAYREFFAASYDEYPNLTERFSSPAGVDFTLTVEDTADITGSLLMDPEQSKQLWSLSLSGPEIGGSYSGKLFLSPERLALSIPDFFPFKEYVTIETETFQEDWAASLFGAFAPLPADVDLNAIFKNAFGSMANDAVIARVQELATELEAAGTVAKEEQVTGEDGKKLDVLSYTYPPEAMKAYFTGLTDFYKETMTETLAPMEALTGESMMGVYDELFAQMSEVDFTSPLVVHYFIGSDKQIKRIEVLPCTVSMTNTYDNSVYNYDIDMAMDLLGEKNTADKFTIDLNMKVSEAGTDAEPDNGNTDTIAFQMHLTRDKTVDNGAFKDAYKLGVTVPGDDESMEMTMDFQWNPTLEGEDNMTAAFGLTSEYENASCILTGSLLDTAEALIFENGRFSVTDSVYDNEEAFRFSFKAYGVNSEDVDPGFTAENSMNFRDITMAQFQSLFS